MGTGNGRQSSKGSAHRGSLKGIAMNTENVLDSQMDITIDLDDEMDRRNFVVTREWIDKGMSYRGGWSMAQLAIIGVDWPPQKGWKNRAIGRKISRGDARRFLSLKEIPKQVKWLARTPR